MDGPTHAEILERIAENDRRNQERFAKGEHRFDELFHLVEKLTEQSVKTHEVVNAFATAKGVGNFLIWWSKVLIALAAVLATIKFQLWQVIGGSQ